MKDPMMEALNSKRGGLVLKISMDQQGQPVAEVMPGGEAPVQENPENPENDEMAPPDMSEMDEAVTGNMTDYDKEQAMSGPQNSLGMKARQAALERLKSKG